MSEHEPERRPSDDNPRPEDACGAERREDIRAEPPRIWVGSLADYNNGILHGEWIDAAREPDDIYSDIRAMLARSETPLAEEWGIFDHEGFGPLRIAEYEAIELVSKIARGIAEHGPAYAAWTRLHQGDQEALDQFEDSYLGRYDSRDGWAREMVDDLGVEQSITKGLPGIIAGHISIDYLGIVHDMEASGEVDIEDNPDGGIWVFRVE